MTSCSSQTPIEKDVAAAADVETDNDTFFVGNMAVRLLDIVSDVNMLFTEFAAKRSTRLADFHDTWESLSFGMMHLVAPVKHGREDFLQVVYAVILTHFRQVSSHSSLPHQDYKTADLELIVDNAGVLFALLLMLLSAPKFCPRHYIKITIDQWMSLFNFCKYAMNSIREEVNTTLLSQSLIDVVLTFRKLVVMSAFHFSAWEGGRYLGEQPYMFVPPLEQNRWFRKEAGEGWTLKLAPSASTISAENNFPTKYKQAAQQFFQRLIHDTESATCLSTNIHEPSTHTHSRATSHDFVSIAAEYNELKDNIPLVARLRANRFKQSDTLTDIYQRIEQHQTQRNQRLRDLATCDGQWHSVARRPMQSQNRQNSPLTRVFGFHRNSVSPSTISSSLHSRQTTDAERTNSPVVTSATLKRKRGRSSRSTSNNEGDGDEDNAIEINPSPANLDYLVSTLEQFGLM